MVTLQLPFAMTVAGSASSGKTFFVKELIRHRLQLFSQPVSKIYYHYSVWQPMFDEMEKQDGVIFGEGVPNIDELEHNSLLVLDDLLTQLAGNKDMEELFCVKSHHNNVSVILSPSHSFTTPKSCGVSRATRITLSFSNLHAWLQ